MLRWLLQVLFGRWCATCDERIARIEGLERQNSDLMDRLMSKDFSHYTFVKEQTKTQEQAPIAGDTDRIVSFGDGLG